MLFFILPTASNPPDGSEWVAPALLFAGGVIVALINGAALVWRRRQDKKAATEDKIVDKKATEKDSWEEVRTARAEATHYYNLYRIFEDLFYGARNGLRSLANVFHSRNPDEKLSTDVMKALELSPPNDLDAI